MSEQEPEVTGRQRLADLLAGAATERRRLGRAAHDDVVQVLAALGLRLQLLGRHLASHADAEDLAGLAALQETTRDAGSRLRALLITSDPDPYPLVDALSRASGGRVQVGVPDDDVDTAAAWFLVRVTEAAAGALPEGTGAPALTLGRDGAELLLEIALPDGGAASLRRERLDDLGSWARAAGGALEVTGSAVVLRLPGPAGAA